MDAAVYDQVLDSSRCYKLSDIFEDFEFIERSKHLTLMLFADTLELAASCSNMARQIVEDAHLVSYNSRKV